jgi:glycosyltransferase involved in cell wall biosynthesis
MLIAQMVGYNEADRFLPEVLDHINQTVDLVVFTDDCSTDNTLDIARDKGAMVMQTPENLFPKDESKLRTFAWKHLERYASPGDWILSIDCDEKFYPTEILPHFLTQDKYDVLGVVFYHMWNETHYRVDKAWRPNVSQRLYRFREGGTFRNRRLACGSEPTYVFESIRQRRFYPQTGFRMQHLGYARDADKQSKFERYMSLDGGDFHAINHIRSIIDKQPTLLEWRD